MSEFSKGVVLEANNFTEEIENIFVLTSVRAAIFKPSSCFRNCLIEVGDTELRPFCSPFSATSDHFHFRFRKDRKECKRGNVLIGPAISRKFFSCRSKYQKEYSDT
jgi:hypothetical protein